MQRDNTRLYPTMSDGQDGNYDFYFWAGAKKMSLDEKRALGRLFCSVVPLILQFIVLFIVFHCSLLCCLLFFIAVYCAVYLLFC